MELTKDQKTQLRGRIFKHLEGFAIASSVEVLQKNNILSKITDQWTSLDQIDPESKSNRGYLNVALRLLCSQGWLSQKTSVDGDSNCYQRTSKGTEAIAALALYEGVHDWLSESIDLRFKLSSAPTEKATSSCQRLLEKIHDFKISDSPLKEQMQSHVKGILVGPFLVAIGMSDSIDSALNEKVLDNENLQIHSDWFELLKSVWLEMDWASLEGDKLKLNNEGYFFLKRSSAYGVTVSYSKTFNWVEELIFGKGNLLWDKPLDTPEIHVDRTMNVWGSGGAHSTYFKKIDEVIIDIFNQPLDQQPAGICDMGCGNGAFLIHLFDIIEKHTLRGKHLEDNWLTLIGADFNKAALDATAENFKKADIEAVTLFGDIGDPDTLAKDLKEKHNINLGDVLNVRSFLDHNRIFDEPKTIDPNRIGVSSGSYAFRGRRISNVEIEQNLFNHFNSWLPYIERFGLLVIELHTIKPEIAAQNIGKTAITAYDGTHGYTDQYIVELDVFRKIAAEAGLKSIPETRAEFPNEDMAAVSIQLLKC